MPICCARASATLKQSRVSQEIDMTIEVTQAVAPVQNEGFVAWKQSDAQVKAGYGFSLIDLPSQWQAAFEKAKSAVAQNTTDNRTLETIASSFDSLTDGAKKLKVEAESLTAKGEMTPADMVRLTMHCHEFMFRSTLTSNAANRTSDGVQQLFRQQS
jgi:hypothetical protein